MRCGHLMQCIDIEITEQLKYVPAQATVIEHRCNKYACISCNKANKKDPLIKAQFKLAKKPKQLIEKSMATPSLLAHIATSKFCDYLPLYRQENMFQRLDINLSRQSMSEWMIKSGQSVTPLINLIQENIINYDVSFSDEITVQVLNEPGRRAQAKSYMWCFIGGPFDRRSIIYQYHPSRGADIVNTFFEGYRGSLHVDGYAGYNKLLASVNIVGINCMAHVRRKFIEALPNGKEKGISGYVVRTIRALYKIESLLKDQKADATTIKSTREKKSKPILDALKCYLDEKVKSVPPQSPVGKAIAYTLKRWPTLTTYLDDGRYEIDNNRAERAIKPFVIGRKNWLFAGSVAGAKASDNLFSLIETAKANGLQPYAYLEYVFKELPECTQLGDYEALLPWNIQNDSLKIKS